MTSESIGAVAPPDARTLAAFGLDFDAQPIPLPGGEQRSFRVDDAILKWLRPGRDRPDVTAWTADLHAGIQEDGFRVSRPLPTRTGGWLTDDGWSAWTLLDGHHDYRGRIPECVTAITRYHEALAAFRRPPILDTINNPWAQADRHAFGDRPDRVHPALAAQVDALYAVRRPLIGLRDQLIHGDLNPGNLLLSPEPPPSGAPPAIIDIAPYSRPAGFALAVFGYWIGPWHGRMERLEPFRHVEQFEQLLVRAGLRMLLSMSAFGGPHDLDQYARATALILDRAA